MARIISIVNQKGGTGKSACTANLAVGLAQKNMKVLIVDADPQSDVCLICIVRISAVMCMIQSVFKVKSGCFGRAGKGRNI